MKVIVVGEMEANCYLLGCERTRRAAVIDPGDDYEKITKVLDEEKLKAEVVINTHGHIDHIGVNDRFGLPIYIHELDADLLRSPAKNLSAFVNSSYTSPPAARLLRDGEEVKVGDISLEVMHTPGHTPGGICLKTDDIAFTGDTLFCGGIGRTDFPGASEGALLKSIREKILTLDDGVVVYPGHGPASTIGRERRENPFLTS